MYDGGVLAVGGGVSGAFKDRSAAKDTIKGDLAVRLSWNPLSRFSTLAAMTSSARFYVVCSKVSRSAKLSRKFGRMQAIFSRTNLHHLGVMNDLAFL